MNTYMMCSDWRYDNITCVDNINSSCGCGLHDDGRVMATPIISIFAAR